MKRKVLASLIVAMTFGATLLPVRAQAKTDGNSALESDVEATVTAGDGTGEPEEPITDKPGRNGTFTIKAASDFKYAAIPLGQSAPADIADGRKLGVEVVDESGDGNGWNVKVSMKSLAVKSGEHAGEELKGWTLTFPKGTVTSKEASTEAIAAPTTKGLVITANTSGSIFGAEKNKGMGRYTNIFETSEDAKKPTRKGVELSVPNTARKESYSGKLKWELSDTPGPVDVDPQLP